MRRSTVLSLPLQLLFPVYVVECVLSKLNYTPYRSAMLLSIMAVSITPLIITTLEMLAVVILGGTLSYFDVEYCIF